MGDGQIKAWGRQSRLFMMETDKKKTGRGDDRERKRTGDGGGERRERESPV